MQGFHNRLHFENACYNIIHSLFIHPLKVRVGVLQDYSFSCHQGRPFGGAPGADFEGAPKRWSLTSHTLIRNIVAW
jgi:hypothetical protein